MAKSTKTSTELSTACVIIRLSKPNARSEKWAIGQLRNDMAMDNAMFYSLSTKTYASHNEAAIAMQAIKENSHERGK